MQDLTISKRTPYFYAKCTRTGVSWMKNILHFRLHKTSKKIDYNPFKMDYDYAAFLSSNIFLLHYFEISIFGWLTLKYF